MRISKLIECAWAKEFDDNRCPSLSPGQMTPDKEFLPWSHVLQQECLTTETTVRYVADVILGLVGARSVIAKHSIDFLEYLLEMNSSRVQMDLLDRVEESQSQLEAAIRRRT